MKTVTICGSMKFADEMKNIAFELESVRGYNVLQCTFNDLNLEITPKMFENLKQAHYRKIDLSDMIYVIDIDGYIGDSVKKEIEYAKAHQKEVVFYSKERYEVNLKKETDHFTVLYCKADSSCIDKVSDILESSYKSITENLKEGLEEKLVIGIYPDHESLTEGLGIGEIPEWVRGGLAKDKIAIASPLNPPVHADFNNILRTAVHEFVHIIVHKININAPRWLDEGTAGFMAKDNKESWIIKTVSDGIKNNTVPTLKELDTGADFQSFFKRDGYQYSYTIVESIVKSFGYDKLHELIKNPECSKQILGLTEDELQDKWMEYIKENYIV